MKGEIILVVLLAVFHGGCTSGEQGADLEVGTAPQPTGDELTDEPGSLAPAALGRPNCDPPSSSAPSPAQGNFAETRATAAGIDAWALLWEQPPWDVGEEVKVVWRVEGQGDLAAVAVGPEGTEVGPSWGPVQHYGSNWQRPGDEWGMGFTLPSPGCWELRVSRDEGSASVWLLVGKATT